MAIAMRTPQTPTEPSVNASPVSVPFPTGTVSGDVLLLMCASASANATGITAPPGWTQVAQLSNTGNTLAPNAGSFIRVCDGTEGGTVSVTHGTLMSAMVLAFTGVDTVTPQDTTPATSDTTTAGTGQPFGAMTVATTGAALAYVISGNSTTITATEASAPAAFTEDADRTVASSRGWEVAHLLNVSAGTIAANTVNPTWSGSVRGVGVMVALRPAAAAASAAPVAISRRPRRLLTPNKSRPAPPPVALQVQAPPTPRRPTRVVVVLRRRRPAEPPVAAQVVVTAPRYVPAPPRRGIKGIIGRRTRRVEVVPPQVAIAPPVLTPDTRRRPLRGAFLRRRTRAEVIPPQVAVAPPVLAPDTRRRLVRAVRPRRRNRAEVTPPQIVVTPPTFIPQTPSAEHLQRVVWRPRRRADVTHGAHHATPVQRRRSVVRIPARRRGRRPEVVPPQATPAPPSYVPQPFRRGLKGWLKRARQGVTGLVTSASQPVTPLGLGEVVEAGVILRSQEAEVVDRDQPATVIPRSESADIVDRAVPVTVIIRSQEAK